MQIRVSDFSKTPLMRHCSVSECSGEEYYHKYLNTAFKKALDCNDNLEINLDGVDGYSPSFIDEIFGNLVYDFSLNIVSKRLKIFSLEEPEWLESIKNDTFPQWEERRKKQIHPKVTMNHNAWWRFNNVGQLEEKVWELPNNG